MTEYVPKTCQYRPWIEGGADHAGNYGDPGCSNPATFISCTPFDGTHTCAAHKCRCAKALDSNGKTAGDRRRELKAAESRALDAAVAWMKRTGTSHDMQNALHVVIALREGEEQAPTTERNTCRYQPEPEPDPE